MTLAELLLRARQRLRNTGSDTADLDARLLVEHFSGTSRLDAITNPDRAIAPEIAAAVEKALARRMAGEPVHRILGFRDFYGLRFALSPGTLEPRPDTEILVDAILPFLKSVSEAGHVPRILDLGTGTGAIALALLSQVPTARAIGADVSDDALATAAGNAESLGLAGRFAARRSDWFSDVDEKFHAIVANPPYIPSEAMRSLSRDVRDFDPLRALDGGEDGLDPYRVIATQSAKHLERDGRVAVEVGFDQKEQVERLFSEAGYRLTQTGIDLGGHQRALVFCRV